MPDATPPSRSRRRVFIAAGVAVVVALAGAGAAVAFLGSPAHGAGDPTSAATAFVNAVHSKRLASMGNMIAPTEVQTVTAQGGSLALPSPEFSPDQAFQGASQKLWEGVTIDVEDLGFTSVAIAEGVQRVEWTEGSISVDVEAEAMKEFLIASQDASDNMLLQLMGASAFSGTTALPVGAIDAMVKEFSSSLPVTVTAQEMASQLAFPPFVVTVEEQGRWYVSVAMTLAEYAFAAASALNPALEHGSTIPDDERATFSTPEAAGEGFTQALQVALETGSLTELAKVLPKAESRLFSVYGPALMGAASDASGSKATLEALTFSPEDTEGDWAWLAIQDFALAAPSGGGVHLTRTDPDTYSLVAGPDAAEQATASITATGTEEWKIAYSAMGPDGLNAGEATIRLVPESLSVDVAIDAGGAENRTRLELTDDCVSIEGAASPMGAQQMCRDADPTVAEIVDGFNALRRLVPGLPRPERILGLAAVQSEGSWNVSLGSSVLGWYKAVFATP
jgi:hypothetical protein